MGGKVYELFGRPSYSSFEGKSHKGVELGKVRSPDSTSIAILVRTETYFPTGACLLHCLARRRFNVSVLD